MDSMDIPSPSSPRSERDGWTIVDRPAAEPLNGDADAAGEPSRPRAASPEPGSSESSADLHDELLDGIKSPASESLADDVLREPFQAPGPLQLQAAAAAANAGAGPVEEPSTPTGASGYHPTAATLAGGSCPDLASAVVAAGAAAAVGPYQPHHHHHQRHSSQQLPQSQSRVPSDVAAAAAAAFAAMSTTVPPGAAAGVWSFERHRERLRAASRLSGEGALEGFQDPQDLALEEEEEEEASAARLSGSSESFGYFPASAAGCASTCTAEHHQDGAAASLLRAKAAAAAAARAKAAAAAAAGGSATCASTKSSAAAGAAAEEVHGDDDDKDGDEAPVVTLGWEGLAAGLWADVLRELEDVRALLAAGAGAVWGRLADGQRALEEWAAGVRASARKAAKAAGRSGCPLWALVGVSGLAAVALAALAAQLLVNRKLAAQLRQRDRDLARLVVKILNLQDALQSAARNMTAPHHLAHAAAGSGAAGAASGGGRALGPHLILPATTALIGMM